MRRYTPPETAIRDCFDAFLDGLERFSSYVQTGLISVSQLRPYLEYWIDDIHEIAKDDDDAAWPAALLAYIEFYRFRGVQLRSARSTEALTRRNSFSNNSFTDERPAMR